MCVSQATLQPFVEPLMISLFDVLEKHEESRENQYIMRAICVDNPFYKGNKIIPMLPVLAQSWNWGITCEELCKHGPGLDI